MSKLLSFIESALTEGSQGRDPVWFEFPIILHRPVPDNAKIKKATVTREKMGLDWKWELNLVVQMPECESVHDARKKRYAGVDIGWRKTKEGLRVAAWFDSDGKYGDFKLDNSYVEIQERLDGLKAAMDKNREEVRAHLLEWCKKRAACPNGWFCKRSPRSTPINIFSLSAAPGKVTGLKMMRKYSKH